MKNSARTTGVVGGGDSVSATVYLDQGYNYNTGTYSTPHVFSEAESGGSGIVLTSGYVQSKKLNNTLNRHLQKDLNNNFFSHQI